MTSCGKSGESIPPILPAETTAAITAVTTAETAAVTTTETTAVTTTETTAATTAATTPATVPAPPVTTKPVTTTGGYVTGSDESAFWIEPSTGDPNAVPEPIVTTTETGIPFDRVADLSKCLFYTEKPVYKKGEIVTIILDNPQEAWMGYGTWWWLYHMENGEWVQCKIILEGDISVGEGLSLIANDSVKRKYDVLKTNGDLPAGQYGFLESGLVAQFELVD